MRGYDGTDIIKFDCETNDPPQSQLRMTTPSGVIRGLVLVEENDPSATKFRVRLHDGTIKALGKLPFTISSCEELQMIGHNELLPQCGNKCDQPQYPVTAAYILENNIDCSATKNGGSIWGAAGFIPIGTELDQKAPFSGVFDGDGKEIQNLYINNTSAPHYLGLFRTTTASSAIKNLKMKNIEIVNGGTNVGGLVGIAEGKILNSSVTGTIKGNVSVGGLAGVSREKITDSYSEANVSAVVDASGTTAYHAGGLVGQSVADISNCHATGTVTGGRFIGGLVGWQYQGTISSSYATGTVSGSAGYSGGLVAVQAAGTISKSYASGNVTSGVVGGGLVGSSCGAITQSYATGTIYAPSGFAGGLVGDQSCTQGSISDSYATGTVSSGSAYVGGLIGRQGGTVSRSYATGTVAGYFWVGGFVGQSTASTISNSYWNSETSNTSNPGGVRDTPLTPCTGVQAKTTSQMINGYGNQPGFDTWTFATAGGAAWKLDTLNPAGQYFPCLAWQDDSTCPQKP